MRENNGSQLKQLKGSNNSFTNTVGRIEGFGGGRNRHIPGKPVVKPKNFKETAKRMWKYFEGEWKILGFIFIFVLIDALITLTTPYLIGTSVNAIAAGRDAVRLGILVTICIVLVAAYISDGFITFIISWIMARISQRIVSNIRDTLFKKLQVLPVSFFDLRSHGDLMSRLTNDIDNISSTISQSTTQLMSNVITIAGAFVMMLVLSPVLTLATCITIPLVYALTRTIAKRTSVLFKQQQSILGSINGHIEESISGMHVVKAFNYEDKVVERFEELNEKLTRVGIKAQLWSGYLMPMMNVIGNIGFTAIAGVGGVLAVKGMISIGVIASFLGYSRQFVRPLNDTANIFNTLQTAVAGAERVFEVLDEKAEPVDDDNAKILENPLGDVEFNNVSFGYRKDVPILKHVNFHVRAGSSVALVGPTGAGKTTIVNLLTRFYDITEGSILIDGIDIRKYTRDSLRSCFGIVLQDTYLFTGTVKENIKYGNLNATDEEVEKSSKMANADSFIKRLPHGYDTILEENGRMLSQGQRQLLAIARAILTNPAILILDEATSSVDTRTELRIQEGMLNLMKGRTSFIIAHRLSTIRDADIIMFIKDGEIAEKGNHNELIELGGHYSNLYFSQFKNIGEKE